MTQIFESTWFTLALKIAITAGIAIFLGGLFVLLSAGVQRLLKVKVKRSHTILVKNLGNVRSEYNLTISSGEPVLKFRLTQNNIPLAERENVIHSPSAENIHRVSPPIIADPQRGPDNKNQSRAAVPQTSVMKGTTKAADAVVAKTSSAASLLGMIGSVLPGSLGRSFKEKAQSVREVQSTTKQAMDKPKSIERKVEQAQKDSSKLGMKTNSSPHIAAAPQAVSEKIDVAVPRALPAETQRSKPSLILSGAKYFRTTAVEPGETLTLTLEIGAKKRLVHEGSYTYLIKSEPIPLEKTDRAVAPLVRQGIAYFRHIGRWRYWIPDFLSTLLVVTGLLAVAYSISMIWN